MARSRHALRRDIIRVPEPLPHRQELHNKKVYCCLFLLAAEGVGRTLPQGSGLVCSGFLVADR